MPQFCHHQSGDLHFLNRNAKQKAKIDIQQMVGLTDLQRLDSQNIGDCRRMVDQNRKHKQGGEGFMSVVLNGEG